jgi:hypothetical protein
VIVVCRASTLAGALGIAAPFLSPLRAKRSVAEKCTPLLINQRGSIERSV